MRLRYGRHAARPLPLRTETRSRAPAVVFAAVHCPALFAFTYLTTESGVIPSSFQRIVHQISSIDFLPGSELPLITAPGVRHRFHEM